MLITPDNQPFSEVSNKIMNILDTVTLIITSVQQVKPQMVLNCFKKCGFRDKDTINTCTKPQDSVAKEELTVEARYSAVTYFPPRRCV